MSIREAQAEEERRTRTYVAAMTKCTAELVRGYVVLSGMVVKETTGPSAGGSSGGSPSRPPLRVEVVDTLRAVDVAIDEVMPLARGALRMGLWSERDPSRLVRTAAAVKWLGAVLLELFAVDPETGNRVTDALWQARGDVSKLTGEGIAPFRSADPCSECDALSVWVDAQAWRSRCSACRHVRSVDRASHVLTLSSTPES